MPTTTNTRTTTPKKRVAVEQRVKPGTGATLRIGSDSMAYTVVWVSQSGKTLRARRDIATCTDHAQQTYTFVEDPTDTATTYRITTRRGRTEWRAHGHILTVGHRREYRDPCF